jgi:hypothetical protein
MDDRANFNFPARRLAANAALGGLLACALLLTSALAVAQNAPKAPAPEQRGFFGTITHWFDQTSDNISSGAANMRQHFWSFGHDASVAAQTTVDTAKDAAESVGRLPTARVVSGHQKCREAPNGAPDCVAAADAICKTKGFQSGKSVDMTTAEECPAQVYLAGKNSGPGCRTVTFVSRALCQ